MQTFSFIANTYEIRHETHQGRAHIVVPVIMLKDGVHNGSRGPLLHLQEEYGRCTSAWNGIPVTLSHPKDESGNLVPANSPQVIDAASIGRIYNTVTNSGLKAEVWIDELKCQEVSPEALEYINARRPLDVSVGVFSDEDETPGQWNGEAYSAIARNHRPDHLALLLGETGACSWDDGCGIRANAKGGEELDKDELQTNAQGFKEICNKIRTKLDGMDNSLKTYYLEDAFIDNTFVFEVRGGDDPGFFKQGYQSNEDGSIDFVGEPVKVNVTKEYTPVQGNSQTEGGLETMAKDKTCKNCPEQVKLIIQSELTRFGEDDREYLEGLEEATLIKLLPMEQKTPEAPQVNKDQIAEVVKDQFKTTEQFLSLAPPEIKDQLEHGRSLYIAQKKALVDRIVANSGNSGYTADDLNGKDMAELTKLASLIKSPVDFSGQGSGSNLSANQAVDPQVFPAGVE